MTKVILDETEWMQLTCKVSELTKEIAKLEVENRNLKRDLMDMQRKLDHYEIIEVNEVSSE